MILFLIIVLIFSTGLLSAFQNEKVYEAAQVDETKILPAVLGAFGEEEFIEVLVKLTPQADTGKAARDALAKLSPAAPGSEKKTAAGRAVVDALKKKAENSQGPLKVLLEKEKQRGSVLEFESYFIVNLFYIKANEEVIGKLSARPDVEVIMPNTKIPLELPAAEEFETLSSDGADWNIERVGAPAVWEQLGIDGTGVVVGMIDTGIYWQHEALQEKWRGFDPQNPDPVYNWYDPVYHTTMPRDLSNPHGTHVMGTILGSAPGAVIGVAPGARWIAANAFTDDGGKISAYSHHILAAAEYMLAPKDANGYPNPDYAPDVINNSWGSAQVSDWFRPMVQNWRNAGIFPVFAAGNSGPNAGSIQVPAYYPESFAVGAVSWDSRIAQFSSRGPGPYAGVIKPDVVAPGVSIRSSVPSGYQSWQGTSMAAPHVAGIVALLRSADPGISVSGIEEILKDTAVPLTDSAYLDSPNYGYGYGLVDAYAAVEGVVSKAIVIKGQVLLEGVDLNPPEIQHTPLVFTYSGVDTPLIATISDETSVLEAEVLLQVDDQWYSLEMERLTGDHKEGEYGAVIPWFLLPEGNLAYQIRARDFSSNTSQTPLYPLAVKYGLEPEHSQDFSSFPFGWRWDGDWGWGYPQVGPAPLEGGKLMATNLQGNYAHNLASILLTPPIDLRQAQNPQIYFDHWYDIELNYDEGIVWITADYGVNWEIVDIFSGRDSQWFNTKIDLSNYAGIDNQVYLAFALYSDYSISYPGWYIDSFTVLDEEITSTVLYFSDFEENNGGWSSYGYNDSWAWEVPYSGPWSAYSGQKVLATNLYGNYYDESWCFAESPVIDLRGAETAYASFYHWYDIEYLFDFAEVMFADEFGDLWYFGDDYLYTGWKYNWSRELILLDWFIQEGWQEIQLVFRFESDESINYAGWYIDDVAVISGDPYYQHAFTTADLKAPVRFDKTSRGETLQGLKVSKEEDKASPAVREIEFDFHPDAQNFNVKTTIEPAGEPETGLPGPGMVTILETGQQAFTNTGDGSFYLLYAPCQEEAELTLVAQSEGYQTVVKVVQIPQGGEVEVNFLLRKLLFSGDVDGDGAIGVADAILVLRHIVGLIDIGEVYGLEALERAKVSGNDSLSVSDAILILRYIVGLIDGF